MRTISDIPEQIIQALDLIAKDEGISRAQLLREGAHMVIDQRRKKRKGEIIGPDIRGMVKEGDPRYFKGMSAEAWVRHMRGEGHDNRDILYKNWSKLSKEEWEDRMRRYSAGEDIEEIL